MSSLPEYDAIVIGSGMGGLAFASIMAKLRKWRVLVLERHFKIGGFTHTFTRPGGWSWDVGLHYVGEMGEAMMGRRLFDLITDGRVKWNPLPDVYDVFVYPNLQVRACKGEANFRSALIAAFPNERSNIEQYFRDLKSATRWANRYFAGEGNAPAIGLDGSGGESFGRQSCPWMSRSNISKGVLRDPRLRAVVTSQWADYGLPPGLSAFATHAVIASHYLNGAWYPDGGAGEIAKANGRCNPCGGRRTLAQPRGYPHSSRRWPCRRRGSQHQQRQTRGRAEFRAPVIVSDAGAWNTFTRMLPTSALPFRDQLKSPPEGFEVVELFLGLRRDPREMGFKGENYWIFESFDHDEMYAQRNEVLDGRAAMAYLSFPSLKDRHAQRHTAEIIAPLSYGSLEAHRNEPWRTCRWSGCVGY